MPAPRWFVGIYALLLASPAVGQILGSDTILLPSDSISLQDVPSEHFPHFVEDAVRRFFLLGDSYELVSRSAASAHIQDVQVSGKSVCLDPRTRGTWQRFRFEVMYTIDEPWLRTQNQIRYNIFVRVLTGQFADFAFDGDPPSDRIRELSGAELTDIARQFTAFLQREMTKECFNVEKLAFCDPRERVICQ
jgi:hypothetical protein